MILADTDVLIDSLHGVEPATARIVLKLATGRLATTSVTVASCSAVRAQVIIATASRSCSPL